MGWRRCGRYSAERGPDVEPDRIALDGGDLYVRHVLGSTGTFEMAVEADADFRLHPRRTADVAGRDTGLAVDHVGYDAVIMTIGVGLLALCWWFARAANIARAAGDARPLV